MNNHNGFFSSSLLRRLEDIASTARGLLSLLKGADSNGSDGFVKDSFQTLLGEGRAFHIPESRYLLAFSHPLFVGNGRMTPLSQPLYRFSVVPQIEFGSYQDDGGVGAVVGHLGVPFGRDVLEGGWGDDGETEEEDVCLGITQRT